MTMALLASWSEIGSGIVDFFRAFNGWHAVKIIGEIFLFFFLIFFVSKVLRDNDATKLMVVYWGALLLGVALHLMDQSVMDKQIFFLYVLLVSGVLLIMFNTEIKKYFWDMHNAQAPVSEKSVGNAEVHTKADTERCINAVIKALQNMSKNNVGALVVLSKGNLPKAVLQSGTMIDAEISSQMIEGVFFPRAPLHDGALIIHGHKIQAAGCFLPLTQKTTYPKEYGTRHRAAIGITEVSNVISLVVSEETGIISIVKQGNVTRYADYDMLVDALKDYYWQELPLVDRKRVGGNK